MPRASKGRRVTLCQRGPARSHGPSEALADFTADGRAAREAVDVSQRQAGKVFGGGPTAFYKYETAKAVLSEGMANLLRLALERPDLFTKPARGTFNWPSAQDAQILRRAITDDRLGAIVRRVYPQTDAA